MLEFNQRQALWGQAFEIAVKRGVLTALLASGVHELDAVNLMPWTTKDTADVYDAMAKALQEVDQNLKNKTRESIKHLFELGMGLGQTAMREYLRKLKYDAEDYSVKALWCPLQLPQLQGDFDVQTADALSSFSIIFKQERCVESIMAHKGFPVRADFLLWLEPRYDGVDREFLCLEFSLNGLPESADYLKPDAHLEELRRFAWFMDTRSVFSRVCAEISGEKFELSPNIKKHLPAFTGRDKPLYKLCQAASYVHTSMRWLKSRGFDDKPCNARALSITQNGFESLGARYFTPPDSDPRIALIDTLGRAYRDSEKLPDCDEEALNDYIRHALDTIRKALPKVLRQQLQKMHILPELGKSLNYDISEEVEGFLNPMATMSWNKIIEEVDSNSALTEFFGEEAKAAIASTLTERVGHTQPWVSLRDVHSAAVVAGMRASALGKVTALGLEGNPGIGKTTAVVRFLKESKTGYLFLYVSPRVIINDDVSENLARDKNTKMPTGTLTVTTNSKLIGAAKTWHDQQMREGNVVQRKIDSAVVTDGIEHLRSQNSSIWILSPEQKETLERIHVGSNHRKRAITERQDQMEDIRRPGVLKVLSLATRQLLAENAMINQVVLTAAIQGYRELNGGKNTLSALDNLFKNSVNSQSGKQERQRFAQRIQTIVVMVDELTGDGAGAPFIHAIANWLDQQFIHPFAQAPLFRVIVIVSDASLSNEIVLARYLNSGQRTPDKVLVSNSVGQRPFRLTVMPVKIGRKRLPVLHIMTNSYPASKLTIEYRVRLDVIKPSELANGKTQTVRQAISEQQGEAIIGNVIKEIRRAIAKGADQVIFFAQDKAFLRSVESLLVNDEPLLNSSQVAILDSSVAPSQRKALIADDRRDTIKVFLMTSSGARGVSFPKTDWIIALIPRFGIESALMEIAQLIYRGRGENYCADDGTPKMDGDWKNRQLVMLLQDFVPQDRGIEPRQWLRQVSDLLTYLVMLRSTIYTRITGDAGLDKQNLAMVPVGGIGSDEILSLMSSHIREFLKEADVFLRDYAADQNHRGLIFNAQQNIHQLFSKFALNATAQAATFKSVARLEDMQAFSSRASAENAPLLISPIDDQDGLLPDYLYCVGPFWLEHWDKLDKQERFNIEGWSTDVDHKNANLFGELTHISRDETLPRKLRQAAEELYRILARKKEEATREFSTIKTLQSPSTWLVVPLDYSRFWKKDLNGRSPSLGHDESAWRDALGACLPTSSAEILPVIARYADIPYVVVIGEQDPARLNLIFDDRYLAVSNELNLLNTILLANSSE